MAAVSRIERLVKRDATLVSITLTDTVVAAAQLMSKHGIGSLVVLGSDNHLLGIVTERDVLGKVVAANLNPAKTPVADIMVKNVHTCTPQTDLDQAERMMAQHHIRHLPIVDNNAVAGMVSSRDVMAHKLAMAQSAVRRQSHILQDLEFQHPGITRLETDSAGRIIM